MGRARLRVDCIVGARPNFVKIAPILRALPRVGGLATRLIHTGQHYDLAMNAVFFEELGIPAPDVNLQIGSGSGVQQLARAMLALEPVFAADPPAAVLVVGDVNAAAAAALVAARLGLRLAHVEAGLRSGDRTMPEEVNRLVVDRLADVLYATEADALGNLAREGMRPDQVVLVGNVMIDSLAANLPRAIPPEQTFAGLGADAGWRAAAAERGFGLVTLHRPSNVDDPVQLSATLDMLAQASSRLPLVFPLHPRTRAAIAAGGLAGRLRGAQVLTGAALPYLAMLGLMRAARLVLTDSGGVQEETTALGVPCLTLRDSTERPITVEEGTNTLVGADPGAARRAIAEVLETGGKRGRVPALWDGRAAERIALDLAGRLGRERLADEEPAPAPVHTFGEASGEGGLQHAGGPAARVEAIG